MAIFANVRLPNGTQERVGPLAVGQTKESYRNLVERAGYQVLNFEETSDFVPAPVFAPTFVPGGGGGGTPGYLVPDQAHPGFTTIVTTENGAPPNIPGSGTPVQQTNQFDFPAVFRNLGWKGWALVGLGLWLLRK